MFTYCTIKSSTILSKILLEIQFECQIEMKLDTRTMRLDCRSLLLTKMVRESCVSTSVLIYLDKTVLRSSFQGNKQQYIALLRQCIHLADMSFYQSQLAISLCEIYG